LPSDISEKFNDCFIVIDKPKGPTSHQVDYWVREITGISRVGHIGTLDPGVTGVLVMAMGKAVKLIDIVHEQPKEYVCVMRLYHDVDDAELNKVLKEFTGKVYQIPPMRSAVARTLRERIIYSIEVMERSDKLVFFRVKCQSGTYIRTLCTDIGYALGVGAQMAELRRTVTGEFTENGCITLQDLKDYAEVLNSGYDSSASIRTFAMDYPLRIYPKIIVKSSSLKNISRGSDLFPGGIKAVIGEPKKGDRVVAYSERNDLIGTGIMLVDHDNIADLKVLDFDRIMISPPKTERKEYEKPPTRQQPRANTMRNHGRSQFHPNQRKQPEGGRKPAWQNQRRRKN
jgi:tRNA pseudouridine55 synthase/H/ACA ribonucleoprotein complex subunit 4